MTALKTMGAVLQSSNIAGGTSGALQTDFPTSVSNVFAEVAEGGEVIEGDFVPGVVAGKNPLKPVSGYNVFPFPAIGNTANYVEGGGDMVMAFKDTPAIRALVQYLATGPAQTIWAKRGGYTAPAKTVPPSAYPDAITRATASAVGKAKVFKFDLSDLQPASFGGTVGQGEFKIFQDFLKNPSNATGIAKSARDRSREGVQVRQVSGSSGGIAVEPPVVAAPPAGEPGVLRRTRSRARLPPACRDRPARDDRLPDDLHDHPELLRQGRPRRLRAERQFAGIDNYKALFTTNILVTAIKNSAIWILVAPALVTAIGLVFAVLTERIRWAVAFKTIVFMPMAISLFATGVIWHLMYIKDPNQGAINAAVGAIQTLVVAAGRALERRGVDERR